MPSAAAGSPRPLRVSYCCDLPAGLGRLEFGPEPLTLDDMVDAAHHIGTFGTGNLFIDSSPVYPTGHSPAPTFAIMTLARRLGEPLLSLGSRLPAARMPA